MEPPWAVGSPIRAAIMFPIKTVGLPMAITSVEKLAQLPEISAIVTYHGGLVTEDALGQLRRVAGELAVV